MPLLETSPAIDAGNNDVCLSNVLLAIDQIGELRVGVDYCIGREAWQRRKLINPKSNGVIPVAILSTNSIDPSTVDQSSLRFGPRQALLQAEVGTAT